MKVDIEPGSGFCFGVENAVRIAEEALKGGQKVYCLGEIVHNEVEVARLRDLGLVTITHDEFEKLHDTRVLVRAHGEPPSTYLMAEQNNITIIEATCPIVHAIQDKITKVRQVAEQSDGQIVIFGKEGHAEVIGLLGAAGGKGILVTGKHDTGKIDFTRPVWLFSQTTRSKAEYELVAEIIRLNLEKESKDHPGNDLRVYKTICRQVSDREPQLKDFAGKHDVIVFVSGKKSSNGQMLYNVCRGENRRSHFITSPAEIDPSWFTGAQNAGVCGATSTPMWLIRQVAEAVENI